MMRMSVLCFLLLLTALPCLSQKPDSTGDAATTGPCSPAVSGSNNQFSINCQGISKEQGAKMLGILNKILQNRLDTKTVMAKLDEILKSANRPVQNCPSGICVGGDINGTATVTNLAPEPKISFEADGEAPVQDSTHPRQCIKIAVDRPMDSPQFAVICDRACKAVGGSAILPHGGVGGNDQWGSIPNRSDIAVFLVGQPNPMPSNVKYRACVESGDEKPVRILDVKKLIVDAK